jgi:hypothetical protein
MAGKTETMKIRAAIFVTAFATMLMDSAARAQTDFTPPHTTSTISATARYEIVQSHLAAKWTFRLDRICGTVYQLVSNKNNGLLWEQMRVEARPKCLTDGRAHFQLFSSSLAARHTFLMNTDSGTTWVLNAPKDKPDDLSWSLFEPDS